MSTLKADTIVAADGTSPVTLTKQSAAKGWVNLTTVTTTAIQGSFNVASVTDLGTGNTDVDFVNNMNDGNYSAPAVAGNVSGTYNRGISSNDYTTSDFNLTSHATNVDALHDLQQRAAVFGDLA